MFTRKRRLKKENKNLNYRKAFVFLIICVVTAFALSFLYLNHIKSTDYFNPVLQIVSGGNNDVAKYLNNAHIKYKKIATGEGFIKVILNDNSEVIFSSKKDLRVQVSSLQLTLSRLTIEGKKLKSLDFRFDNPVISFE